MTAESTKIWRCPSCNRLLIEKGVDYARARHEEMLARTRCGSAAEFVREATWPAYLASLKGKSEVKINQANLEKR